MHDFNRALIVKLGWFLMTKLEAQRIKTLSAKYLRNPRLLGASILANISWIRRGIMATTELLRDGVIFVIGNGSKVKTWTDPWIPGLPLF